MDKKCEDICSRQDQELPDRIAQRIEVPFRIFSAEGTRVSKVRMKSGTK